MYVDFIVVGSCILFQVSNLNSNCIFELNPYELSYLFKGYFMLIKWIINYICLNLLYIYRVLMMVWPFRRWYVTLNVLHSHCHTVLLAWFRKIFYRPVKSKVYQVRTSSCNINQPRVRAELCSVLPSCSL